MSILETPRLAFRGRITWDPIVTNNYPNFYDEDAADNVMRPGESVANFRAAAIDAVTSGNWNPHGTHRSCFYETEVVSVDLGAGARVDDALVGRPVSFAGMLVDAEPYGAFTSQLFFDRLAFGIDGGSQIKAARAVRMTGRFINFERNLGYKCIAGVASVLWQTSFPKDEGLVLAAHGSRVIEQLAAALAEPDVLGLTVRWCAYRTIYYDSTELSPSGRTPAMSLQLALQQKLRGGGFQPNPARSELVGTLGLWRRGEPACVPGDRALQAQEDAAGSYPVATAMARVSSSSVTLDLSNSIKETGLDLVKQDLGTLSLVTLDEAGAVSGAPLGELPYASYAREAYDLTAGVITLPLSPEAAERAGQRDLGLVDASGKLLLRERVLRACPDTPNLYLDAGETGLSRVLVLDRGAPITGPATVTMAVQGAAAGQGTTVQVLDGVASFPMSTTSDTGSVLGYVLMASRGEAPPPPPQQYPAIDPQVIDYFYVRVLPADSEVAKLEPTWANVYARVLSEWQAMAPCMDNWLRLDDPDQVKAYAALVRKLTDKSQFEAFRYMPVTRDLSAGKRALLYAWLGVAAPALRVMAEPEPAPPTQAERSRRLRR